MRNTPSIPLLPGSLCPGVVVTVFFTLICKNVISFLHLFIFLYLHICAKILTCQHKAMSVEDFPQVVCKTETTFS